MKEAKGDKAEIDSLRAELEETMCGAMDAQGIAEHWTREADRLRAENAELKSENIRLETRVQDLENAAHEAFEAMCSERNNHDAEVLQDAIDTLGLACLERERGES